MRHSLPGIRQTRRIHPRKPRLAARALSSDTVQLSWTDNAANEDGFVVERKQERPGGTSADELTDESGQENYGTLYGDAQVTTNEGLVLDGDRDYAVTPGVTLGNTFTVSLWEQVAGGQSSPSIAVVSLADGSTRSVPGEWLERHGLSSRSEDLHGDRDRDGLVNWREYEAGTHPGRADSDFDRMVDGELVLEWQSVADRRYSVQARTNLSSGKWETVLTGIPATPPRNTVTVDVHGASAFYRIVVMP